MIVLLVSAVLILCCVFFLLWVLMKRVGADRKFAVGSGLLIPPLVSTMYVFSSAG